MSNIKVKITRKAFEKYLNEVMTDQNADFWIIGGKIRMHAKWTNTYGTALRKYDPIAFNVGFNEWKNEQQ